MIKSKKVQYFYCEKPNVLSKEQIFRLNKICKYFGIRKSKFTYDAITNYLEFKYDEIIENFKDTEEEYLKEKEQTGILKNKENKSV